MADVNELLASTADALVNASTGGGSLVVQTIGQAAAKLGKLHELSVLVEGMSNGQVNNTVFLTGDKPVILRSRIASYTGSGVVLGIYEGATYTGGVDLPSYNLNKITPIAPIAKFISGATIVDMGAQAFKLDYLIGNDTKNGSGGTGVSAVAPGVLAPNTAYLFTVESLDSGQDVAVSDEWFEGDLDFTG